MVQLKGKSQASARCKNFTKKSNLYKLYINLAMKDASSNDVTGTADDVISEDASICCECELTLWQSVQKHYPKGVEALIVPFYALYLNISKKNRKSKPKTL